MMKFLKRVLRSEAARMKPEATVASIWVGAIFFPLLTFFGLQIFFQPVSFLGDLICLASAFFVSTFAYSTTAIWSATGFVNMLLRVFWVTMIAGAICFATLAAASVFASAPLQDQSEMTLVDECISALSLKNLGAFLFTIFCAFLALYHSLLPERESLQDTWGRNPP